MHLKFNLFLIFLSKLTNSQKVDEYFEEIFGDSTIDESVNVYDHVSSSVEDMIKLFHHETFLAEKLVGINEAKSYIDEIKQRYNYDQMKLLLSQLMKQNEYFSR